MDVRIGQQQQKGIEKNREICELYTHGIGKTRRSNYSYL